MSMGADTGGAVMEFVAREIIGDIPKMVSKFNEKTRETEQKATKVKNPVIVFFPNGTSQVMPLKQAEKGGYTRQPKLLNLQAVDDSETLAGRFKFAMTSEDRIEAWMMMENSVIDRAQGRNGRPVPEGCKISDKSLYVKAVAATTESEDA